MHAGGIVVLGAIAAQSSDGRWFGIIPTEHTGPGPDAAFGAGCIAWLAADAMAA